MTATRKTEGIAFTHVFYLLTIMTVTLRSASVYARVYDAYTYNLCQYVRRVITSIHVLCRHYATTYGRAHPCGKSFVLTCVHVYTYVHMYARTHVRIYFCKIRQMMFLLAFCVSMCVHYI